VPLVALLLKRIDARLLLVFGATMLAIGSWIQTGLTHDWASGDFIVSQLIEAVGLAFAITSVIAFAVANCHAGAGGSDRHNDPDRAVAGQ
jgi:DHA2 family multidrug resistance protein